MKVKELLNYSASFYEGDFTERIKELSEYMELDLNRKIDDLSYGNKKKVGIVQGLLHKPELIILDEPTSGLDPLMQQKFFNLLEQERKDGATILFSSHILSEVQRLCDRVAIIKEGKIIRVESVNDLSENKYKKVRIESAVNFAQVNDVEGVTNFMKKDNVYTFLYNGDINNIVTILKDSKLDDLSISEPTLEEIFMHYYE
jgi:ABC-2 type transport system ATP-binding protein